LSKHRHSRLTPLLALLFFVVIAALPFALQGQTTPPWVQATKTIAPAALVIQPSLSEVSLSKVATPVDPNGPPATLATSDAVHMSALVAAEDLRLRTLLHHVGRLTYPIVMPVPSGRPTLVLPGPASYTIADLEAAGAVVPLRDGSGYALEDSVLVAAGASLKLGGGPVHTLLMDSSPSGFTSLVTWGGTLVLAGDSSDSPFNVTGWDSAANKAAVDGVYGRPYIRAVGGRLDLTNVRVSSLGFWSGRTGGVAWTGISSKVSTGSALSSTFVDNYYGAFTSRADQVSFSNDLFESNELDGLRLHRTTTNSTVVGSASARNGANGFVISRGATGNTLRGDMAVNNGGNGFLINGQSLVTGISPSGNQTSVSIGTDLQDSEAVNNLRTGILVEGGAGTNIQNNIVCAAVTGIAVRLAATDTWIAGNDVRCGSRIGLEIGPAVTGTTILENRITDARIGLLIRNSPGVRIIGNRFTGISLFGVSVRGTSPGVVANDNTIAGKGFQPIDTRGGADTPTVVNTDLSGWQHRSTLTVLGYLRYHPIMTTWLVIVLLVAVSALVVRLRRRAPRPYMYTTPWRYANDSSLETAPALRPATAAAAVSQTPPRRAAVAAAAVPVRPVQGPTPRPATRPTTRVVPTVMAEPDTIILPAAELAALSRPLAPDEPAPPAAMPARVAATIPGPAAEPAVRAHRAPRPFVWRPQGALARAPRAQSNDDGARGSNEGDVAMRGGPEPASAPAAAASDRGPVVEKKSKQEGDSNPFWNLLASGSWTAHDDVAGSPSDA